MIPFEIFNRFCSKFCIANFELTTNQTLDKNRISLPSTLHKLNSFFTRLFSVQHRVHLVTAQYLKLVSDGGFTDLQKLAAGSKSPNEQNIKPSAKFALEEVIMARRSGQPLKASSSHWISVAQMSSRKPYGNSNYIAINFRPWDRTSFTTERSKDASRKQSYIKLPQQHYSI